MKRIFVVALLVATSAFVFSQPMRRGAIKSFAGTAKTAVDPSQETSGARRWEVKPGEDLKGAKGRLVVNFHDEVPMAHMLVKIYSKDGGEPLNDRKRKFDLLPGA